MATSDEMPAPAPESRFTVSPLTLAADRWMGRLIRIGGVGVVVAVLGMLGFLIFQVFPLFVGAKVSPESALTVPAEAVAFGEDEYGEFPFVFAGTAASSSSGPRTGRSCSSGHPRSAIGA